MGVELRRMASFESPASRERGLGKGSTGLPGVGGPKDGRPCGYRSLRLHCCWWAAVVLGSGVAIIKVGAHTQGPVLMLTARPAVGNPVRCALSTVDKNAAFCAELSPGMHIYAFRLISVDGDRIELGVRTKFTSAVGTPGTHTATLQDAYDLPEMRYWFEPGDELWNRCSRIWTDDGDRRVDGSHAVPYLCEQ